MRLVYIYIMWQRKQTHNYHPQVFHFQLKFVTKLPNFCICYALEWQGSHWNGIGLHVPAFISHHEDHHMRGRFPFFREHIFGVL